MQDEPLADFCLVLEGTYPWVMGGVSSWVHGLIDCMPEHSFYLWSVVADDKTTQKEMSYELPPNVVGMEHIPLVTDAVHGSTNQRNLEGWVQQLPALLEILTGGGTENFASAMRALEPLDPVNPEALFAHPDVWQILLDIYQSEARSESMLDFFWTFVNSLRPIIHLLGAPIPKARAYHTISTGYAGWLAARASQVTGSPMIITEHGIYTKERRIEINQAKWILDRTSNREGPERELPYFRNWWIRSFAGLSRAAYDCATRVLTIHYGNTALQIRDGAASDRMEVIPNGIHAARIAEAVQAAAPRDENAPFTVGFIGRVAPIKDLITLIDATAIARSQHPDLRVRVMGPSDEDEEYAESCMDHARRLGVQDILTFDGRVNVLEVLPHLDVVILTSISEAQPLVLLEAYAAHLPVIATDVGASREMVYGRAGEDQSLGQSGLITPIGSPVATAKAIVQLAKSPDQCRSMGEAGYQRVRRFYREEDMIRSYRRVYDEVLNQGVSV